MMDGAGLFFTHTDYKDTIKFFRHLSGYLSFYCVLVPKNFWYWACTTTVFAVHRIQSIKESLGDYFLFGKHVSLSRNGVGLLVSILLLEHYPEILAIVASAFPVFLNPNLKGLINNLQLVWLQGFRVIVRYDKNMQPQSNQKLNNCMQ